MNIVKAQKLRFQRCQCISILKPRWFLHNWLLCDHFIKFGILNHRLEIKRCLINLYHIIEDSIAIGVWLVKSHILYTILEFIVNEWRCQLALRVLFILICHEILLFDFVVIFCGLNGALDLITFLFVFAHFFYLYFAEFALYFYNFWFSSFTFWKLMKMWNLLFVFGGYGGWTWFWREYDGSLWLHIEIFFIIN